MRSYQLDGMEWIKVGHPSCMIHHYTYTHVKCSSNSDTKNTTRGALTGLLDQAVYDRIVLFRNCMWHFLYNFFQA